MYIQLERERETEREREREQLLTLASVSVLVFTGGVSVLSSKNFLAVSATSPWEGEELVDCDRTHKMNTITVRPVVAPSYQVNQCAHVLTCSRSSTISSRLHPNICGTRIKVCNA